MKRLSLFLYSDIVGRKVYDEVDDNIGNLKDIYVTTEDGYPKFIGYRLKKDGHYIDYEFRTIRFYVQENNKIKITVRGAREIIAQRYSYLLSKNLLDRKIVDINGKKVVTVSDLRVAEIAGEYRVLAVESGPLAKYRKLHVDSIAKAFMKLFHIEYKDSAIMWDDVESLEMVNDNLKLAIPYQKLSKLHPADLADILEDLDYNHRKIVFESFDENLAADILEEIEPKVQESLIKDMSDHKAQEVFDNIPNDEIADILEELDEDTREKILMSLENTDASEVRELMSYKDETVGSIMNKDFISFNIDVTVGETIDLIRELNPEDEVMYYIYIIDEEGKLQGVVSFKRLLMNSSDVKLRDIMEERVVSVNVDDKLQEVVEDFKKYDLVSLPVIDIHEKMIGIVVIHDILDELL